MSYKVKGIVLERDNGEKIVVGVNYNINQVEPRAKELREFAELQCADEDLQDVKTLGIVEEGKVTFGSVCIPKDWGSKD